MKIWTLVTLFLILLYSPFSLANGFDSDTCNDLSSNGSFSVKFEIEDAELEETIWAEKKGGGNSEDISLWSDNPSVPSSEIRAGNEIQEGNDYRVWLSYDSSAGNNKSGLLTYYLWLGNQWVEISNTIADLSSLNSVNIKIDEDDVEELECSTDLTPPPLPEYSDDAQYEFGVKQCASMPCTINFSQDYNFTPLVFVMPTIDTVDPDEDKPATLYISSALTASSTSVQINKDTVNIPQMDNDVLITEVSYLIIEPGVADFNGHKVVAGYTVTNAQNSKSAGGTSTEVEFENFGWDDDLNTPVVLHQIQTRNNGDKWMTSGKTTRNDLDSVRLFLELSASRDRNHNYVDEKIAFIATESVSNLTVDNYDVVFARGFQNANQTGSDPMNDACTKAYADISSLSRIDGIIGKKQERRGGHGGWTRRCEIKDDNQVSFVIDEDFRDRTHLQEEIGYFAFENQTVELPDICPYFPADIATNKYFNDQPNASTISFSGARNIIYLQDRTALSFNQINASGTNGCSYGGGGIESCLFDSTLSFPDFPPVLPAFQSGNDNVQCDDGCQEEVQPGSYNKVIVGRNGSNLTFTSGEYWVEELILRDNDAKISVDGPVVLHYKKLSITGDRAKINEGGNFDDLTLIGHGSLAPVNIAKNDVTIHAQLYIDPASGFGLTIQGARLNYEGSIVAPQITSTNNDNNIKAYRSESCDGNPPSSNYSIVLTPPIDIALTCDDIPLTATVYKDGAVHNSYAGNITLSVVGQSDVIEAASSGVANFDLSYTQVSNVTATASAMIEGDEYEDSGSYEFVPYLYDLSANPLQVIAGRSQSFEIRPMECSSGGTPISSTDYTGVKTLELSVVNYDTPSSPANSATISLLNASSEWVNTPTTGIVDFTANFNVISNQVVASSELIYPESGAVSYILSGEQCVDDENGDPICKTFSGSQAVESIPWRIAICNVEQTSVDTNKNPSTTTGTPGFMPSGEIFNATYIPIVHEDYMGSSNDYCSFTITENYAVDNGPLNLDFLVSYPTSSSVKKGEFTPTVIPSFSDTSSTLMIEHTWDEVGTIKLTTSANYFGRDIVPFDLDVGRFYPALFKVIDTRWDYPNTQVFAYMSQPFDGIEFDVEALNSSSEAVQNYALFNSSLQAKFNLFESAYTDRFVSPSFGDGSWNADSNSSIGTFTNIISTDCSDSICWHKQASFEPDGPFNTAEAIEYSNITLDGTDSVTNVDPIDYTTDGAVLTDQPDIRFGRINLKDVGGNQGTEITVPLAVEYWNGSRFVTNTDDSDTQFDGQHYCQQVIWSEETDNASLSGSDVVEFGESSSLESNTNRVYS